MTQRFLFSLVAAGLIAGCVPLPRKPAPSVPAIPAVPPPAQISRASALLRLPPGEVPLFDDDLDTASLHAAAQASLTYYQGLPGDQAFILATDTYTARDMAESMTSLLRLLESGEDWRSGIRSGFAVYQSVGTDPDRTVTFSSYYEPAISARLKKDGRYQYPLYARPADLVDVDLGLFDPAYQGAHVSGRREGKNLVPYPTRADIDSGRTLKGRRLEIAWAKDPVDILDLQIEGSGWLDLGIGTPLRIRYDGDNGRRYQSVGQHLISTGRLPAKAFSRQAYLDYLARHPQERQSLLNVNERYIFFRVDRSTAGAYAFGNIEVPLTAGRSIATDPKLFPKGALAWISTAGVRRFVVNQDEGGAIQGPGRVDIFAGRGAEAARFASHLWNSGRLYLLVKKRS